MDSDFVDVALEACSFGSFALGAQDTPTSTPRRSKARAKAKAKKRSGAERRRRARARTDFALTIFACEAAVLAAKWAVVAADKAKAKAAQVSWGITRRAKRAARKAAACSGEVGGGICAR